MTVQTFLRIDDVTKLTGFARSSLYYHVKNGTFPRPYKISAGRSAWLESEVAEWQQRRIAERDSGDGQSAA